MTHVRRPALLGLLLVVSAVSRPRSAGACCNVIPTVSRSYQSNRGNVWQRVAVPNAVVTIGVKPCDTAPLPPPSFDTLLPNNEVTITFRPPKTSKWSTVRTIPFDVRYCDLSNRCTACTPPGMCNTLWFVMPVTDHLVGGPADGRGLTGPAQITVRVGGVPVADVFDLFQPNDGCDKQPEGVFETFTVLPSPNSMAALLGGTATLQAAIDGSGSLVVPLDHTGVLPGTAPAIFERGDGRFDAFPPAANNLFGALGGGLRDELGKAKRGPRLLRAFTLDGQSVLPLFDRDDAGAVFGIADVRQSVIRIARVAEDDTGNTKTLYDVRHRMEDGKGPIVLRKETALLFGAHDFEAATCDAVKLPGLRVTDRALAHLDGDDHLDIHAAARAGEECGVDTGVVPAGEDLGGGITSPAVEAQGNLVATIGSSDAKLHPFGPRGGRQTPLPGEGAAVNPWRVNGRPLATAGDLVYFWSPAGALRVFDRIGPGHSTLATATAAAAAGEHAVAVASGTSALTAHARPSWTSMPLEASGTAASGTRVAMARDLIVATVLPGDKLTLWPWPETAPTPQAATLTTAVADEIGTTRACAEGSCATRVVVTTNEAAQGSDVNQDGDQADRVLRVFDGNGTEATPFAPLVTDFVAGASIVAFRTSEALANRDLNFDGDLGDTVLRVVAFNDLLPITPRLVETAQPAAGREAASWPGLGWRTPYVVRGSNVLFITRECDQHGSVTNGCATGGTDLNRDGDAADEVLQVFAVTGASVQPVAAVSAGAVSITSAPAGGMSVQVAGATAGMGISVGDHDRDGVLDPYDVCETRRNPRQYDDDRDGLGDRGCDPTYCSTFTPPPLGELRPSSSIAAAALAYLRARLAASRACLDAMARGEIVGEATTVCRGRFVGEAQNLPAHAPTAARIVAAERVFAHAVPHRGREAAERALRRVVRAYAESGSAATRVAYGNVRRLDGPLAATQAALGEASQSHLLAVVGAMQRCLLRNPRDPVARCLGRLEAGEVHLPTEESAHDLVEAANARLLNVTGAAAALPTLRSCASDDRHEVACLVCVNWRQAVEAVAALHVR